MKHKVWVCRRGERVRVVWQGTDQLEARHQSVMAALNEGEYTEVETVQQTSTNPGDRSPTGFTA